MENKLISKRIQAAKKTIAEAIEKNDVVAVGEWTAHLKDLKKLRNERRWDRYLLTGK